jgi:hypothetical protein
MRKVKITICFLLGFYATVFSQLELEKNFGVNVGFVGAFGTHVQRFGIVVQGYALYNFAQINASFRVYDNIKDLGPKGEHPELGGSIGLCLGYGNKSKEENWFMTSVGNQTGYKNSVAYSYNIWYNKIKTSQVTGIISLQFNHFSFITENDLLAKPVLDRFRTGAFIIQYQSKQIQYGINCTLWTGKMGQPVKNDSVYPGVGYINDVDGVYSNISHGLISGQVKYANEYGQYLQANAGVDAEKVRNVVQNKIIHDMPFVPKKYNKANNLHIPMTDTTGHQYLFRKDQKIKRTTLFLNGYMSPNIFY